MKGNKMEDELEPEVKYEPDKFIVQGNTVAMNINMSKLNPDRVQFKPYGLEYYAGDIWVQVIVPEKEVVELTTEYIILTPTGIALVADQLSSALEDNYNEWRGRSKTIK
jgi:hypothetical protein